ncbi:hypothetical protein BDN72DRAFT_851620 [Pluteus cervinus]|uniref:Uncharacterized protein n=2 Tax=Pluteus cervinus TaxID=181527 RepID=A0ACD2ZZ44_9AGAR|nr:hypothetical protein BDN72DRAFT_851634 [Pluteus cervinus]TFK58717.1 hypothetical protein BDN72DRAFT_851620 [Pluteus cervinus]
MADGPQPQPQQRKKKAQPATSNQEAVTPPPVKPKGKGGRPPKAKATDAAPLLAGPGTAENAAITPASLPKTTSDSELEELARLRAEVAELKAKAAEAPAVDDDDDIIQVIPRPRGEGGNGKTGFRTKYVMKLEDNEEHYNGILCSVRDHSTVARIDYSRDYDHQDPDKVAKVLTGVAREFPYTDKARFPAYWATAEMLKLHIRYQRKKIAAKKKASLKRKAPCADPYDSDKENGPPYKRRHINNLPDSDDESDNEAGAA